MQLFEVFCISLFLLYAIFIAWNIFMLLNKKKETIDPENYDPSATVSIIVPVRNEEQNILKCLQSIAIQNFPKNLLQLIVVDDHSADNTARIAETILKNNFTNYKILHLEDRSGEAGKKAAILKAITQASGKIIITRDADTYTNDSLWLKCIVQIFETKNCDLLISPVILSADNSFLATFQQFENLAISALGISMAKNKMPFVCSGANLAYKKEAFINMEPYADNRSIASGDDMFLLKHFYHNKRKIEANTANHAPVYTPAEDSFKKMLSQRLRWASKTTKINTFPVFFTGLLVLLTNVLCLPILSLAFINSFYWSFCLFTLTLKFIIDFLLLFLSAHMYQQKVTWLWFPASFLFNGLYVPLIVIASIFIKPTWKSRPF